MNPRILLGLVAATAAVLWSALPAPRADRPDRLDAGGVPYLRVDTRANTHTDSTQDNAALAMHEDGSTVIAWESRRQQNGGYSAYAQRFAADGTPRGGEFAIQASAPAQQRAPAIGLGRDGSVWFAGQSFGQDGDLDAVFGRTLDRGEFTIAETTRGSQTQPSVATLHDGQRVVAWTCAAEAQRTVRLRRFDRLGVALGREIRLGNPAAEAVLPCVVATADGFAVAWAETDSHGARRIFARHFAPDGSTRTAAWSIAHDPEASDVEPGIDALPHGGIVLTWHRLVGGAAGYDVMVQRFDRHGNALAGASTVHAAGADWPSGATVAAAPDGRFVVAFNLRRTRVSDSDVWAQCFDAAGDRAGRPFRVHRQTAGEQELAVASNRRSVAYGRDGRMAFAWSGDGGMGDRSGAHLTLLLPDRADVAVARRRRDTAEAPVRTPAAAGAPWRVATELAEPHDPPVFHKPNGVPPPPPHAAGMVDPGFLGVTNTGWTPPDPHLAAGPEHVVVMTNGAIAFFKKDGTKTFQQDISNTAGFWGSVGAGSFVFDPEVIWDPYARRFFAMACERTSGRSYFVVAVSDDWDPNGSWHKYRLDVTAQAGGSIDSPNIAVDENVLYLGADFGYLQFFYDKSPFLSGQPPTTVRNLSISGSGSFGLPVMHGRAPAMYLIEHLEATSNSTVLLHAIRNPLTTPTVTTTVLSVPAYGPPARVPQLGTTALITTFDSRFWSCVWRDGSLWACHHHGSRTLARWYQIETGNWPTSGAPRLVQSGDIDPGPGIYTFFNSISVDDRGNAVTAFARSATNERISIGRAFRLASDPLGTMRPMDIIQTNTVVYSNAGRWGDYSAVSVDPADNATFWYFHEFATSSAWSTWVANKTVEKPLSVDVTRLSQATGGKATFTLSNPSRANRGYVLFGSFSGMVPGVTLPGPPSVHVPVNLDVLTVVSVTDTTLFQNFLGNLDSSGGATATLTAPSLPGLKGLTMYFAFVQDPTAWNWVSNVVSIEIGN
ncbi:MAG: hypothetical protein H6836_05500 [Planctomycetes bacterium]|nr:hypothetical protein [Planctomycetota bacterium]